MACITKEARVACALTSLFIVWHTLPYANSCVAVEITTTELRPQEIHLLVMVANELLNPANITIRELPTFHYRRLPGLAYEELGRVFFL